MLRALVTGALMLALLAGGGWWAWRWRPSGAPVAAAAVPRGAPPAMPPVTPPAKPPAVPVTAGPGPDAPPAWLDRDVHYRYIVAAQRDSGAIALTPGSPDINPYFANLAAQALLTESRYLPQVERYMDWYLERLNADATIDDHRLADDGREVALGRYDSADSYAATFLSLVAGYVEAGGDPGWVVERRGELDRVAGVMERLTDADGLTWAKPMYPLKLLMDNCEVYRGWTDWGRVLERLGDAAAAGLARERAAGVAQGLARFRQSEGTLAWAVAPLGLRRGSNPERFYPDGVAQFFPLVFGLSDNPAGYLQFRAAQPSWHELKGDKFPWMMAALAAYRSGDDAAAEAALATAAGRYADLSFPWYVTESAWVIRLLAEQERALPAPPGGARPG